MSLGHVLSSYILINVLVLAGYLTLGLLDLVSSRSKIHSSQIQLKIHYFTFSAILIFAIAAFVAQREPIFQPVAKVWSASSLKNFNSEYAGQHGGGLVRSSMGSMALSSHSVSMAFWAFAIVVCGYGLFVGIRDLILLCRIRRRSYLIRKVGRCFIFGSSEIAVPFSFWIPGRKDVVLPTTLITKPLDLRIALSHELQHHRQGDTRWIHFLWPLRMICAANPAFYFWNRWLMEIQEFACDETLVDRKKVDSRQYARCLIEVAETAIASKRIPDCATGMTLLVERHLLKRRIERMISISRKEVGRTRLAVTASFVVVALAATALAAQGLIQDQRVSLEEAQRMADRASRGSQFPIVVNDLVLKQLNRYMGTPEGREFMKNSLRRMENYRSLIEGKLKHYGVPEEIMAVPIVESGYQNLEATKNPSWGAGIWMFIASTARHYGLRVNEQVDERLNVDLLTDAAMRYLKSDRLKFKDWQLALLSYNMGESKVFEAIEKTGSRDAWVLVRKGYENDKDYLAKVMAAVLIMKNPTSVQ